MQGLAKTLVIDDDLQHRHDLSVILNFVGEQHEAVSTGEVHSSLLDQAWGACLLGKISSPIALTKILDFLQIHHHIPVIALSTHNSEVAGSQTMWVNLNYRFIILS